MAESSLKTPSSMIKYFRDPPKTEAGQELKKTKPKISFKSNL
jgi:hypothetical protein